MHLYDVCSYLLHLLHAISKTVRAKLLYIFQNDYQQVYN